MTDLTSATPFDVASDAIVGARSEQQDVARIVPWGKDAALCILADGMGGHVGGSTASRVAVDAFAEKFRDANAGTTARRLAAALTAANEAIYQKVTENPELDGMGCTMVAALVTPDDVTWISVGDSLLYAVEHHALDRLNADHSGRADLDKMVAVGEISAKAAKKDRRRNMLLSALTGDDIAMIDTGKRPLARGTRIFMATDGVETLSIGDIGGLLAREKGSADALRLVLAAVEDRGLRHQDNTTCILAAPKAGTRRDTGRIDLVIGALAVCGLAMIAAAVALSLGLFDLGGGPS